MSTEGTTQTLATQLEAAKANIFHIETDIQWAYADGFTQRATKSSGTRNGALVSDDNEPKSGNPKTRKAYWEACTLIHSADFRLASLLYHQCGIKRQPALNSMATTELPEVLKTLQSIKWRLNELGNHNVRLTQLEKPLHRLYLARMALHTAFQDETGKSEPDDPMFSFCQICGIRERKHGPRCHTCYVYKLRHDGEERPKELDNGSRPYEEAKANQLKHGIGFGIR